MVKLGMWTRMHRLIFSLGLCAWTMAGSVVAQKYVGQSFEGTPPGLTPPLWAHYFSLLGDTSEIIVCGKDGVRAVNPETGGNRTLLEPSTEEDYLWAWNVPKRKLLLVLTSEKKLILADLETKEKTRIKEEVPEGFKKCIVAPDGTYFLAVGGMSDSVVRYWSLGDGMALRIRVSGTANIEGNATLYDGALSPDGRVFATASGSGNLDSWSRPPMKPVREGTNITRNGGLSGIAFSSNGKLIATAASFEPIISLIDPTTCEVVKQIECKKGHPLWRRKLTFLPMSNVLAIADGNQVGLLNTDSGMSIGSVDAGGIVKSLEVSPDGRWLAAGTSKKTIVWWRLKDAPKADAQTPDAAAAEGPRAVVTRWLELHRTGNRDEASALTTGSDYHRAHVLLPSRRDTGVRVARSLGNQRVAAVVTSALNDADDGERVLLFWLVRRDGAWRINKSELFDRQVVDERLRGFLEADGVRWHVQRDQLLGNWEAGPCRPPGGGGVACGSRLQLGNDNRYRLAVDGPGGPVPEYDMQGKWQLANGQIVLSHQDRLQVCRVVWMADNLLVIEPLDKRGEATGDARYERADAARDQHDAATSPNATRKVNSDEKAEEINWQIARTRKHLSETELEQLLKDNVYLALNGLESITVKQAEMLGTANGFSLDSVKELSDRQVELLSRARFVSLNGLTALTDKKAKSLGNCEHVSLASLKSITATQCESLQNLELLELNGLKGISNEVAAALGKIKWLQLNSLQAISVEQIELLGGADSLRLDGLTTLTDAQFVAFGKAKNGQLSLNGLRQLTDFQAEQLSNISDLHLGGLKSISDRQAQLLGKCTHLGLDGLTELSEPAAAHLGNVAVLFLGGINKLSDSQAKQLSRCLLYIGPEAQKIVEKHR